MDVNQLKKLAAEKAVEEISPGMIVGLGSGSTVQFALEKISEKIKNGELQNIRCVPSSNHTEAEANRLGIPITTFEELIISENASAPSTPNSELRLGTGVKSETADERKNLEVRSKKSEERSQEPVLSVSEGSEIKNQNHSTLYTPHSTFCIDVTIDGADETDAQLNLIKGGGGALLREKILAQASKKNIIIVDESKLSEHLGTNWPVPIEVIQFAAGVEQKYLESLGAKVVRRKKSDGTDYITDENNFILDTHFGEIKNPEELSALLNQRAGIVENGLFIGLATKLICAMSDGEIKIQKSEVRNQK